MALLKGEKDNTSQETENAMDDRYKFRPLGLLLKFGLIVTKLTKHQDANTTFIHQQFLTLTIKFDPCQNEIQCIDGKRIVKSADSRKPPAVGCTGAWLCGLIGSAYGFWIQNNPRP